MIDSQLDPQVAVTQPAALAVSLLKLGHMLVIQNNGLASTSLINWILEDNLHTSQLKKDEEENDLNI